MARPSYACLRACVHARVRVRACMRPCAPARVRHDGLVFGTQGGARMSHISYIQRHAAYDLTYSLLQRLL